MKTTDKRSFPATTSGQTSAANITTLEQALHMRRGGVLSNIKVAWESWGKADADNTNTLLLFTGLSPSAHAAHNEQNTEPGWWEEMLGPGKPVDTNRFRVICVNSLGSCFGSTGPASINPETGERYRTDFPDLTIEDIATAGYLLIRQLGIVQLHTVIGPSMGGMTALAFAILFPDAARNICIINAATRSLPFTIAIRSMQREIISSDSAWNNGMYEPDSGPVAGMRMARKLGMTSYRSPAEWNERFLRKRCSQSDRTGKPFSPEFEIEAYLQHHANKFIGQFDANCYLYLSRAMDWFDVSDYGGSIVNGLAHVNAENALVIGVETDLLFPVHQQWELADGLRKAGSKVQLAILDSLQGHDAFLVDIQAFGREISNFLSDVR